MLFIKKIASVRAGYAYQALLTFPADLKASLHRLMAQLILFCTSNWQKSCRIFKLLWPAYTPCNLSNPLCCCIPLALAFQCKLMEGQGDPRRQPYHRLYLTGNDNTALSLLTIFTCMPLNGVIFPTFKI